MAKINVLFIIALMAVSLCGIYAGRVNVLSIQTTPRSAASPFSPTIDGQFNISEHWELAENMHMAFLQTDANHSDNYNYIYTSRVQNHLYMMVDLCSDITNTTTNANWIALWFDTDNSRQVNSL